MKYTQQDKARILRITTRTLQNWKRTKPELYAIIEASFLLRESIEKSDESLEKFKNLLKDALPSQEK
ncbi:hypothetical protein OFO03_02415 [Campylobacter sp. JMF_02 ED1]|uniref:hypothetical protein n=1 Tax=unclassified Campylobacter TaxID=2593542 RepID=UPI0022E99EE4|nr:MULTISPECIES: hypothetical protein [unclassified Campylobacter]MDA3049803.1 hypothetical protein [Campylobacter sp. JMF_15 NE4]MDA3050761.1 hypothetical protein [Campylobacter sp. JMF_02 ED1]